MNADVVSTPIGAKGLEVRPGVDLPLAESSSELASQCCMLMRGDRLTRQLVANGYQLWSRAYTLDAIGWVMRAALGADTLAVVERS